MTAVRSDDLRTQNRSRALEVLRRHRVASRTDIGSITGLSPATVSAITADFLEQGVVLAAQQEGGTGSGRGRPQVALELNPGCGVIGAVHFQLNGISVVIADYAGNIVAEFSSDLSAQSMSAADMRRALRHCIEQALTLSPYDSSSLRYLTIGVQGVIDADGTLVLWSPITRLRDIPLKDWMEGHFKVPTHVSNDCDLIAQALHWREPELLGKNFAAVLLDHGVGMGLFLRNSIVNGTHSSGIEFGHMNYVPNGALCRCGNRGCIEAYAGDYAISRRARAIATDTKPTETIDLSDLELILDAAKAGDADAIAAIDAAGAAIGTGLASLFTLVDSFPVVLVGGGTLFYEHMEKSLRKSLENSPTFNEENPIKINCFSEVGPLVLEGGMISALQMHDRQIANNRFATETVS